MLKKFPQYNFFVMILLLAEKFDKKFDIVIFNQILWYILEKLDCSFLNSHRILKKMVLNNKPGFLNQNKIMANTSSTVLRTR